MPDPVTYCGGCQQLYHATQAGPDCAPTTLDRHIQYRETAARADGYRAGQGAMREVASGEAFQEANQWHAVECPAPEDKSILRCCCHAGKIASNLEMRIRALPITEENSDD